MYLSEDPKFFIDSEFIESGSNNNIELLSIAVVNEKDEVYYAVNAEANFSKASQWVRDNVLPFINMKDSKTREQIRVDLEEFYGGGEVKPEFWAWFGDYDWVVHCQLWGSMMGLPRYFPMFALDAKQLAYNIDPQGRLSPPKPEDAHNPIADAKWTKQYYDILAEEAKKYAKWE